MDGYEDAEKNGEEGKRGMNDNGCAARTGLGSGVECRQLAIKAQQCKDIILSCSGEQIPSFTIRMINGCCGLLPRHIIVLQAH